MEEIKKGVNLKMMHAKYDEYLESDTMFLWQCYDNYSWEKAKAFEYCEELQKKYDGFGGRIISFNLNMFTYGFMFEKENKKYFAYITKNHDRFCEVE